MELTQQDGWKTQDGSMTERCRVRLGMHSLAPHFFVILPSWGFQPSCCVSSLLIDLRLVNRINAIRSRLVGACYSTAFLSRRFHSRFIFRSNLPGMRLPSECHDQSQETNWQPSVTGPELPFFHKRKGILKINQSVKMPWHWLPTLISEYSEYSRILGKDFRQRCPNFGSWMVTYYNLLSYQIREASDNSV